MAQSLKKKKKKEKDRFHFFYLSSESAAILQYFTPQGFSAIIFNTEAGYDQISEVTLITLLHVLTKEKEILHPKQKQMHHISF